MPIYSAQAQSFHFLHPVKAYQLVIYKKKGGANLVYYTQFRSLLPNNESKEENQQ